SHDHGKPDLGMQPHLVAHPYLLPLWSDSIHAVDVTAHQILQHVVTVEATPALSQLGEPRPDIRRSAANDDSPSRREIRVWEEVIARHHTRDLLVGCTPSELPQTDQEQVRSEGGRAEHSHSAGLPAQSAADHLRELLR